MKLERFILKTILISILRVLSLLVPVLVNVAFFTLLERKILGFAQARKGPNKVSGIGVLQPMADAVKLFLKENNKTLEGRGIFLLAPALGILLVLSM